MVDLSASATWKTHPIYYVGVGVALGIAFAMTWLAPARDGNLRIELLEARRELAKAVAELAAAATKVAAEERRSTELTEKLTKTERDLRDAQFSGLFMAGSAYPVGLSAVRIGYPISKIAETFGADNIEKNDEDYWTVSTDNKVFNKITFYFDSGEKAPKVTHILFQSSYEPTRDRDFVRRKLIEAIGEPTTTPRPGYFGWQGISGVSVYLTRWQGNGFLLAGGNITPGYWPRFPATSKRAVESKSTK